MLVFMLLVVRVHVGEDVVLEASEVDLEFGLVVHFGVGRQRVVEGRLDGRDLLGWLGNLELGGERLGQKVESVHGLFAELFGWRLRLQLGSH